MKHLVLAILMVLFAFVLLGLFVSTPKQKDPPQIETTTAETAYVASEPVKFVSHIGPKIKVKPQYGFTEDEVYLLAQLLCGSDEISGDGVYDFDWSAEHAKINHAEISKVLCVVMNRVRSDEFPDTVTEVVMQKNQFGVMINNVSVTPSDIAIEEVREWCEAYDKWDKGVQTIPEDHLYFSAGPNLTNVTRKDY